MKVFLSLVNPSASWLHLFVKTHETGKKYDGGKKSSVGYTRQPASGNLCSTSQSHHPQGHFKQRNIIHHCDSPVRAQSIKHPHLCGEMHLSVSLGGDEGEGWSGQQGFIPAERSWSARNQIEAEPTLALSYLKTCC